MLTYYPQQDQNSKAFKLRAFTDQFPELDLIDVKNAVRVDEIERRKRRGKGAPKKGTVIFFRQPTSSNTFRRRQAVYSQGQKMSNGSLLLYNICKI